MSKPNKTEADKRKERTGITDGLSRRKVLSGVAASGALLGGMGVVSASGQGGQAVVTQEDYEDYEDTPFEISEVGGCTNDAEKPDGSSDGSCWDDPLFYQCEGKGGRAPPGKDGTLPFPYWHFNYVTEPDDAEPRKLWTRDNEVRTDVTYRWSGNDAKECPNPRRGLLRQTGFTAGNG